MKALGLLFVAAGAGLAGYAGYKYYKQEKGLGSLSEGANDYNGKVAQQYYMRLAEISNEQKMQRLGKMMKRYGQ